MRPIAEPKTPTSNSKSTAHLALSKTVGTDPGICAAGDSVDVAEGTSVYYCFQITNQSAETFDRHTLVDSKLGTLLNDFPYLLAPGGIAFITAELSVYSDVVNTATWSAENTGSALVASAVDSATVTVHPAVGLTKTVGIDPRVCSASKEVTVLPGTNVYYCYTIKNLSNFNFASHDLEDSELGVILNSFPYLLAPGASAFVTQEFVASADIVNTATYTAYKEGTMQAFSVIDSATVHVIPNTPTPTPTSTEEPTLTVTSTATSTLTPTETPTAPLLLTADLQVQIEGAPDPVNVFGSHVYTITVTNLGPKDASGVQASLFLPQGVQFVSASSGCANAGGTVTCSLGSLIPSGEQTLMVVVNVQTDSNLCALAQVSAVEGDPDPLNNSALSCAIGVPPSPTPVMTFHPADINENRAIGPDDLLELLRAWKLDLQ